MSEEEITSLKNEKLSLDEETGLDQSSQAEAVLQQILQSEQAPTSNPEDVQNQVSVAEAIASRPIIDQDTGRVKARVLIVTTNEDVLRVNSTLMSEYVGLSKQLDELHIICLIARKGAEKFDRVGDNLWVYQVRSKNWWNLPWAGKRAAIEALTWNGTPRPDVVVGVDPFEAGLGALLIARKFKRPLQYHIYNDPFDPDYKEEQSDNNWRIRLAKFLLRRAKSVRTHTNLLKESLSKRYKKLSDISVLPRFYNFSGLLNATPAFDLHQKYKDFVFIMLAFGPLTADSHLHDIFTALNRMLHNPKIGLVVVGDGPARELFHEKVKLLGIDKSVVFVKEVDDMISYLKTADLLLEASTDEEGERRVLQAAVAGLPIVMTTTPLRKDLFKDGTSAFMCEPKDLASMTEKVSKFINTAVLREQFSDFAKDIAKERLHEDPEAHFQALALSIESVLIPAEKS